MEHLTHPAVDEWFKDPKFNQLKYKDKVDTIGNFFDGKLANDDYYKAPIQEQADARDNFIVSHLTKHKVSFADYDNPEMYDIAKKAAGDIKAPQTPKRKRGNGAERTNLGAFFDTVKSLPENLGAKAIMAIQGKGGASVTDRGVLDNFVNWVEKNNQALSAKYEGSGDLIPGVIGTKDLAEVGGNLAFSGVSIAGSAVGGIAGTAAGALAGPAGAVAGRIGGQIAGGAAAAYNMDTYQTMNSWLEKVNQESIKRGKGPLTKELEAKYRKEFSSLISQHGAWEAGPEGVGNMLELALVAGKNLPGMKWAPKGIAGKVGKAALRGLGVLGVEEGTETITQMGQQQVESKAGMTDEAPREWTSGEDLLKSAKEVFPQVLLLAGFMSAGGHAYRGIKGKGEKENQEIVDENGNVWRDPSKGNKPPDWKPGQVVQGKQSIEGFFGEMGEKLDMPEQIPIILGKVREGFLSGAITEEQIDNMKQTPALRPGLNEIIAEKTRKDIETTIKAEAGPKAIPLPSGKIPETPLMLNAGTPPALEMEPHEPELTRKETAFNEMADRLTAADTRYIQDRGGITEDLSPDHLQNTLSDIFAPDKYGVQPVKLEEIGFTPGQITEMKKEGYADPDGTMSEPQFDEWIQVQQEQKVEEISQASEVALEERAAIPFQQDRGGLIEETKPTQEMAEWRASVETVLPTPAWQGVEAAVAPVTPTTPDVKQEPIPKGASEPIVDSEVPGVGVAPYDPDAFDKKYKDGIKKSKAEGNKHLDSISTSVESMRGQRVKHVITGEIGVITTVDNRKNIYVKWEEFPGSEGYVGDETMLTDPADHYAVIDRPGVKLNRKTGKYSILKKQSAPAKSDVEDNQLSLTTKQREYDNALQILAKDPENATKKALVEQSKQKLIDAGGVVDLEADYNGQPVEDLVELKKQKYGNADIESPMSPEEKLLDKVIAAKWSEKNQEIKDKRKPDVPGVDVAKLEDLKEMLEDTIATKKANGQKPNQVHLDKLNEINSQLKGEEVATDGVASDNTVFGHPEETELAGFQDLIPIRVSSRDAVDKFVDRAQNLLDGLQEKIGKAEAVASGKIKSTPKKKKAAKAYLLSFQYTEDVYKRDSIRNDTMKELNRLHRALPEKSKAPAKEPGGGEIDGIKIYKTTINGKQRWAVQNPDNKGTKKIMGDSLHDTREEAEKEAKFEARRIKESAKWKQDELAKEKKLSEQKAAKDADDVSGFVADSTPLKKGRVKKALSKEYRFNGKIMSVRDRVESLNDNGELETSTFEEPKIKPMKRRAYNRASQSEQDQHDRKMKDGGNKTVYLVNGSEIGKTAYDYANHLLGQKPKPPVAKTKAKPAPEKVEKKAKLSKIEAETERFYKKVSKNRNNPQELKKLGLESQKEADDVIARMSNGASNEDALYSVEQMRAKPKVKPTKSEIRKQISKLSGEGKTDEASKLYDKHKDILEEKKDNIVTSQFDQSTVDNEPVYKLNDPVGTKSSSKEGMLAAIDHAIDQLPTDSKVPKAQKWIEDAAPRLAKLKDELKAVNESNKNEKVDDGGKMVLLSKAKLHIRKSHPGWMKAKALREKVKAFNTEIEGTKQAIYQTRSGEGDVTFNFAHTEGSYKIQNRLEVLEQFRAKISAATGVRFSKSNQSKTSTTVKRAKRLIDKLIGKKGRENLGIDIVETVDDLKRKLGIFGDKLMVAFHGTPHTWQPEPGFPNGRMRLDKIFSKETVGEGGWAYGAGGYFAGLENLAEGYRDRLTKKFIVDEDVIDGDYDSIKEYLASKGVSDFIAHTFAWDIVNAGYLPLSSFEMIAKSPKTSDSDKAKLKPIAENMEHLPKDWSIRVKGGLKTESEMTPEERFTYIDIKGRAYWYRNKENPLELVRDDYEKTISAQKENIEYRKKQGHENKELDLETLKSIKESEDALKVMDKYELYPYEPDSGSLYELDIPDSEIPKLLDWDLPLSEQTEYVKKRIEKAIKEHSKNNRFLENPENPMDGKTFYSEIGEAVSYANKNATTGDKAASEYLASIGIPGNTHGGVSQGATGKKYVIWDQAVLDKVALLKRNQKALKGFQEAQDKTDVRYAKEETLEGIDPDTLSKEVLSNMNRTLKATGYDVRGAEDIKALLKRGRSLRNPDWISAYQKAIGSVTKRKETLKKKSDYKNINWSRMRELGNTTNLNEAGYIKPDGKLSNLSGKKEGGESGSRSYDHREAGGTNGMQEIMAYGYIRMDNNSGSLDIAKEPTAQQYGVIREIAQNHNGALTIDLEDGLGAEKADYYSSPERTFSKEYPEGVKANRIVNDIKRFFSGETPVPLNVIYAKDGETILGAYHPQTGRITLVAQSLHKDNAWSTVLHEVVHQAKDKEGWKGVFGTRSPRIIKSIEKKIAEGDKAWKAAEAKALKWKSPDTDLLEETITYYLADNANADQGLFRRILNAIRAWAVNAGIKREISSKDLVALAENMVQRKAQGEAKNVSQPSVFAEARMSKEQKAAKWYSQMEKFLAEKLPGKGTPESMKQMLNSWAKKGEYKAEELSWSGVLDWLDTTDFKKLHERQATDKNIKSQDEFDPLGIIKGEYKVALPESSNKVLKQDVLDYLAENNVRIEEVVKGGPAGAWTVWDETTEEESYFETKQEAKDYWRSINGASEDLFFKENTGKEDPKYSQYQVPGGENYKELLLTLPGKKGKNDGEIADLKAKLEQTIGSPEDVMALEELTKSDTNYKSTHWPDNPNVLAHIRFNERTVDGKRVLFIEEIQSDWASDIRKKGVKNPELGSVERKALEDRLADIQKRLRPKAVDDGDVQRHAELSHEENAIYAKLNSTGTPNAPWQKTYYLKAMQRMVRYAAENGFDSVSWTPGSVHSNRWGTEKIAWKREGKYNKGWDKSITGKINKLKMQRADAEWASEEWFAIEAKLGELQKQLPEENSWFVSVKEQVGGNADNIDIEAEADTRGLNVQNSELVKSKAHLKELIGRIAQRTRSEYSEANYKAMVDARTDKVWDAMQTDDEGVSFPRKESFESIYDKKIVNDVNKFFGKKAWGKAKVGKDTILTTDFYGPDAKLDKDLLLESGEGVEVHTLPITEQMRSKAMTEGMPRFAKEEKESFADNYLKQFIEAQPKAKQAAVKAKVQKEKKRIEKELPDIQKSLWDTVRNLPAVKEGKPDVKAWQGLLSIPAHYFNDVAALGRMYMNGTKSGDNRSLMTDKITKAEDDHYYTADLDSLKRPSLRLPRETRQAMKAAYKSLTKYLKHRDQKQVGYSILENEETKQWDLYHYKDKKRQKPIGSFNGEAEAVDAMIQAEANDYRAAGATDQAADALIASRRISNNGFNMLSQAIRQLREQYEKRGEQLPSEIVNVDGKAVTVDLKLALSSMGDMRGFYMPRIRKPGRFVAFATKDGANPIRKHFEFKKFAQKWVVEQRRKGYKANIDKLQKMPEDVFEMAGKVVAHEALINEALAKVNGKDHALEDFGLRYADRRDNNKRLFIVAGPTSKKLNEALKENGGRWRSVDKGGPKHWVFENPGRNFEKRLAKGIAYYNESMDFDTKSQALFAKVLTEQVSNIIKARGARQHMIGRRDAVGKEVWEGYEEDPAEAMGRYARGIAAGEAKKIMARDMLANFTGTDISWQEFKGMSEDGATYEDFMNFVQERRVDPKKQPNAFKDGKIFMEDMLRNEEAVDRLMGFIRGLAVLKYLAGRVSAPVINLTAMATSVPATMNGLGGIPLNKVPKHLAQAGKMYHQYAFGKEDALPADIRLVFDTIYDNGWQESQLNREAMAVLRSKAGRGWDKMMDMGMMGFGVTEKINRVTTITGAYLGLKAQGGTDHDVMMAKAKEISDKSHGTYGKVNYPLLARGKHPAAHILKAFYVFQTFTHNYLLTMREMYGDKVLHPAHKKALAYMAISPAVLAGAGGMVGWDILMKVIGSALGIDEPEEEIYKWLYENIGRHAEDLARFGLFGTLGINIKGSLAIGGIPDIPTNLVDLAGAPGSVVMDVYHGLENITKGDVSKGLEKIAPLAIGNPIKAYREYTEGLTTRSNTPLYFGNKQVKADMTDALLRTFSFNPAKIARVREIQWSEKQKERKYREMKSDINRRIKAFYVQPIADRGKGEWADILEDIREYNLRISKAGMVGTVPLITAKSIASFVRRSFKPPKRERMRQLR